MSSKFPLKFTFLAVLFALTGCALGPNFRPPTSVAPATLLNQPQDGTPVASTTSAQDVDAAWWLLFNDPILVALERDTIAANLDLQAAATRVGQSRAALQVSGAAALPRVGANASQLRERASPQGILALTGTSSSVGAASASGSDPFGTSSLPGESGAAPYSLSQFGIDASWELDLWGRARRTRESAAAQLEAARFDTQGMRVSITAEVARTYLALRGVQNDLRIAHANANLAEKSLHVAQRRVQQGMATTFDMAVAAAQLASIEAAIPDLTLRRTVLMNALAMLMAKPPHALDAMLAGAGDIPALPEQVPVGLPSQLAHRRPDILRSEAQLHAATAAIGVAHADFYPTINLTGSFGFQALNFSDVGAWSARQFAVGPVLNLPIFEGGRLKGNLALTEARQQEAAIAYQRTVLAAWHEVDNAMAAYRAVQQRAGRYDIAVAENRKALINAERRYAQGAADYLTVLVTQQRLLDSENAASHSRTDMAIGMVSLYKALGGGWQPAGLGQ